MTQYIKGNLLRIYLALSTLQVRLQPLTVSCRDVAAGQSWNFTDDLTRQTEVVIFFLLNRARA